LASGGPVFFEVFLSDLGVVVGEEVVIKDEAEGGGAFDATIFFVRFVLDFFFYCLCVSKSKSEHF